MPYTKSPTNDTYSTHRIPLVHTLKGWGTITSSGSSSVGGSQSMSQGLLNLLPVENDNVDEGEPKLVAEPRMGVKNAGSAITTDGVSSVRGMYVWEKSAGTTYIFVVVYNETTTQTKVYSTSGVGGLFTAVNTLTTLSAKTPVRFTEFIDATNVKKLVMVDGIEGYVFTTNAAGTKITDVDFPTPHVPFPVFLDGYLFLAKAGTGDIYNSDLNDPAVWTAGSFISSEMYPDDIQALVKVNNYILAIGKEGSEYFYDAANATASPLARQEGASLPFGTVVPNTIAYNKDTVVLLANTADGSSVFKYIEGFKTSDIPHTGIIVNTIATSFLLAVGTSDANKIRAFFFRHKGELVYCVNLTGYKSATKLPTFYMHLKYQICGMLAGSSEPYFPVQITAPSTSDNVYTFFAGTDADNAYFGTLDPQTSQDTLATTYYPLFAIQTPELTFGTMNVKFMSRATLAYSDSGVGTAPLARWSVAGYSSFSTGQSFGTTAITAPGGFVMVPYTSITQLGMFRSRSFYIYTPRGSTFYMSSNAKFRYLEFDINKGQQ